MPADLANAAAVTAEGYPLIQEDRGASANPRYISRYERWTDGDLQSGFLRRITGTDNSSQATADASALAALNAFRRHTFGTLRQLPVRPGRRFRSRENG
jgi:hypothetical protein